MAAETAFRSEEQLDQKQFRRWVDSRPASDINHYELINGRIVMTPPAGWPDGGVGAAIVARMSEHVRRHGLGVVLDSSAGYDLPSGDTVEPDVSFIASKRFAGGPQTLAGPLFWLVPTLVVGSLSRATA